ncbi:hydroxyacid dehydrogenase [Pseudoflavonifractor sp. 60]|uniref:NAD(P)-dependent oxidoreductase n=1 Tax=Pseudoflavonifractor sp. 60 TaxID=2304576 RepID=UPI00136A11B3|nr:NAD(P)-dependent oxidoreductase [Pseudoflavonifractor sp. 60]NBI66504.1 hydroxyacid dehydrogenase [Pseudoflavonifractor sp. 60]
MKILIFGPKSRYDLYRPDFVEDLPVELVFAAAHQSTLQAAREHPDAEVVFADAITRVDGETIAALPQLRMIHSEGVAYNAIDIQAARERGVFVCNNKGCNAGSVAEHTVMLMLMALRQGVTGHRAVKAGEQIQFKERFMVSNAPELGEQTVGIIGLGDIGTAAARLLRPFGCTLYYYTAHRRPPQVEAALGVTYLPLEELAARCDILSLHCAVNEETAHLVNEAFLSRVKPGAILVNTARGQLVDNLAVRQALLEGRLGGVAVDTLDPEPTPASHPLVDLPAEIADRAVYSPHLGGITGGVFRRAHRNMWNSVRLILEGKEPNFIVNMG